MSESIKKIVGDALYTEIMDKLGDKKIDIISDNYIPKDRFTEVIGSKNELKTQIGELTGQLELLKGKSKGNEDFEKIIAELQQKNGEWESKYQNTLFEAAIKQEASKDNPRDISDILAFIKKDGLEFDQATGKIKGLSTQLTELKKSKPYLFDLKEGSTNTPTGSLNPADANNTGEADDAALRRAFGL